MINIDIQVNSRYFVKQMLQNDEFIKKRTAKLVNRIAYSMRDQIRMVTPVRTGRLKNSIRAIRGESPMKMYIKTSVPYARFVEYGTGIHNEFGNGRKTPWGAFQVSEGIWRYTKGQKPRKYMRTGFDNTIRILPNLVQEVFK